MKGRTKHGGVEISQEGAPDWHFDGMKLTGIDQYTDQAQALRELGLPARHRV